MESMTGFGRGIVFSKGVKYLAEMSSVNHKYLDINFRIPGSLYQFQEKMKEIVKRKIERGHIEVYIFVDDYMKNKKVFTNYDLAREYLKSLKVLKSKLKLDGNITVDDLLKLPDIMKVYDVKRPDWPGVKNAVTLALNGLVKFKQREGLKLKRDFQKRIGGLKRLVGSIVKINQLAYPENKKRIEERVKKNFSNVKMDESRLYSEISLMLERADITEEITRLKSHIDEFNFILSREGSKGRKIDFLIQEMMREINTVGSKCNSTKVSHSVINFKEELEKIREQVQNVE